MGLRTYKVKRFRTRRSEKFPHVWLTLREGPQSLPSPDKSRNRTSAFGEFQLSGNGSVNRDLGAGGSVCSAAPSSSAWRKAAPMSSSDSTRLIRTLVRRLGKPLEALAD